jgi:broad specificity phosphatase PhoE
MELMILRHLESIKNIKKLFSSDSDDFTLTEAGVEKGKVLAKAIRSYIDSHGLSCSKIHIAKSERARRTAELIYNEIGKVNIIEWDKLRSLNSGALRGKTEKEAEELNPKFMEQLRLFRCGLFNSYEYEKSLREDRREFEKRVLFCIEQILEDKLDSLKIVIVHHSTLQAIMIHFARLFYNYPTNFYGKVDCELGNFYLINITDRNSTIELCNANYSDLEKKCY